jgi:formylglycine-generating enzyme required for sulfatase activity
MNKPPAGGPGGATPATLGQDQEGASPAKKGTKNVLAALSGAPARGARKPQKSFAAVWVLLFLLAAGGGGGGFYYYQYVYLPAQRPIGGKDGGGDQGTVAANVTGGGTEPQTGADGAISTDAIGSDATSTGDPSSDGTDASADEPPFDETKAPKRLKVPLVEGVAMEFVIVPSGKFTIGTDKKGDSFADARPPREVELTKAFYIGRFEVTVGQFAAYLNDSKPGNAAEMALDEMGIERSEGRYAPYAGMAKLPVRAVTHEDARSFYRWMSKKTGLKVTLPGEVEWEYAARGPESPAYPWGDDWDDALCNGGKKDDLAQVGSHPDGASWCGAEDMAGNVFEWCADKYKEKRYRSLARKDPAVLGKGSSTGLRVMRGGAYCHDPGICSSAYRFAISGTGSDESLGFRVMVAAAPEVEKYAAGQ